MRVLLLGSGGREHAIGWKLAQSPLLTELISCPGNPGLAHHGRTVTEVDPTDPMAVASLAVEEAVDLVVIGPEAPLAAGVADALRQAGVPVFGPGADGAMLEASKSFANNIMAAAGVPTGASWTFSDRATAIAHLRSMTGPYVVKADGLAAGKGVLVCASLDDAEAWVDRCLDGSFGPDGGTVVIEEHMTGDEVSVFFLCAAGTSVALEPARDFKRLADDDQGPNTGGMGAFSPIDDLPPDLVEWTKDRVVTPTLGELARRGIEYTGFLYVGLMLTDDGPKVVEFNCRLGDPETQAVLPRLETDLLRLIADGIGGGFTDARLTWTDTATVDVVIAAAGYPEDPQRGLVIDGLADAQRIGCIVFHAGTRMEHDHLVSVGGRIVNIVGIGTTIEEARARAYAGVASVRINGSRHRTDIARARKEPT